ncbi:replicative DNA helicase [Persicirhabdus sediminis]|uniref:Replicative DNA helicase n=1 Tax=Persicirhabdus sediminis TaxID=454144 RepID=A0A8J7SH27_9BACT|nr:replicative DNA helicase [Persicirhabdus sediminis]MBK1789554.1 replicative DNA helicase [Persicirhabdus sediminis]
MSTDAPAKNFNKKSGPKLQEAPSPDDAATAARALPHAIGPEKSILSSMLQDPQQYIADSVQEKLTDRHFYHPAHGKLYEVLLELYNQNEPIELVSLTQTLMDRELLSTIGGAPAITEIYTYAPTHAHFGHHLSIIKEKFVLRSIIGSCTEAIHRAYEDQEEVEQLLDQVEQEVMAIREGAENQTTETIKDNVQAVVANLEKFLSGDIDSGGLKTGYKELDTMSNGLKAGDMFILAARPSMGKTSLAMNFVEHVCLDQGLPAMVFSLEMSSEQLVQRLLFSRARFAYSSLQKGFKPSKQDLKNIMRSAKEIAECNMLIDDTPGISINELRAKARRAKMDRDIQFIAIDYLQLMKSNSKQAQNSREREVAEISAGLKAIAKELKIPVLVLAQLNRGPENRTGGTPKMSDLRESGSIEQDADMIGLLYRTAYYAEKNEENAEATAAEVDEGKAELVIAKNRNGETGSVPLTFIANLMRFETRAWEDEPN